MSHPMPRDPAQALRDHGLQVTAQRLAVLRAVAASPHASAEEVETQVRSDLGTVSRQAVYDALGTLVDRGVLRRASELVRREVRPDPEDLSGADLT